jgi:hypothetical protein
MFLLVKGPFTFGCSPLATSEIISKIEPSKTHKSRHAAVPRWQSVSSFCAIEAPPASQPHTPTTSSRSHKHGFPPRPVRLPRGCSPRRQGAIMKTYTTRSSGDDVVKKKKRPTLVCEVRRTACDRITLRRACRHSLGRQLTLLSSTPPPSTPPLQATRASSSKRAAVCKVPEPPSIGKDFLPLKRRQNNDTKTLLAFSLSTCSTRSQSTTLTTS